MWVWGNVCVFATKVFLNLLGNILLSGKQIFARQDLVLGLCKGGGLHNICYCYSPLFSPPPPPTVWSSARKNPCLVRSALYKNKVWGTIFCIFPKAVVDCTVKFLTISHIHVIILLCLLNLCFSNRPSKSKQMI